MHMNVPKYVVLKGNANEIYKDVKKVIKNCIRNLDVLRKEQNTQRI